MEVKINREIRSYTESMFFGLSMRQFIFSVLAIGVAVGLYFLLRPHFGVETVSWMCILGAVPFALLGFGGRLFLALILWFFASWGGLFSRNRLLLLGRLRRFLHCGSRFLLLAVGKKSIQTLHLVFLCKIIQYQI